MQEASMSLQSIAVLLPYKETPIANSQLHRFNRISKSAGPRWTRRRLLVTNGAPQGREPSKELRLDQQDMMAIEFGRLLGESKEKTISKVLRRKIDPTSTYIGLEKDRKAGKEFIKKADFAGKIEQLRGASRNGYMFGPDVPRLASPPSRPNGVLVNLPKAGANADAQEILEDSLLRKPVSNQTSKAVSSIMSSMPLAANNVKRPESQRMKAVEERSVDMDMLRRPSLDKGGNELKESNLVFPPKSVSKSPSQSSRPDIAEMLEDSDCMEASKREFQRLLDKAFNTSTAELASPPMGQSNLFAESTAQDGSRLVDAAANLPNLASPPSRHSGSIGTFIQPAQRSKETPSLTKNPSKDTMEESLLRKPGVQASNVVTSSSAQSSEEFYTSQDNQSLMPPNVKNRPDLGEASAISSLAAAPSRHRGSLGKFIQPRRAKIKDLVDNSVDESLLRKPSILDKETVSMVNTPPTEYSSTPLSTSKQTQSNDETLDDNLLPRPPKLASTPQIDNTSSHQTDGLKQGAIGETLQMSATVDDALSIDPENSLQVGNGSNGGNEVLEPVLKIESSAQSHEQLAELRTSNALKDVREGSNVLSFVAESGRSHGVNNGSGLKRVKVAALKKPARVTSSDSAKRPASEEREDIMPGNLNSNNDSKAVRDIEESVDTSLRLNNERDDIMPGNLGSSNDSKTVHEVEQSVDTLLILDNLIGDPSHVSSLAPDEASFGDQQSIQAVYHKSVPEGRGVMLEDDVVANVLNTSDVEASSDESSNSSISEEVTSGTEQTKSLNMLRRPPQQAEFSTSELALLEASNPKLNQAKEEEVKDWARAEALLKAKEQVEVKMIGSNSAGLFVSLGCIVGFLPSFELTPKRGLVDFSSWAQQKGFGSSQKKAVKGANDGSGTVTQNVEEGKEGDLDDLRNKYREEVSKLMSSFVGEKTKVIVKLLDKGRRKLRVSEKEADPGCEELLQKKANLMAELKLGEVVTCQVKSITPIGVFVEVDGVPALIHHSEVSWNTRVDPASLLSIGEVIKAKVCRLDRTLQRINLSLKQMQVDPLKRTLESVVGDLDTNSPTHEVEASASLEMNWPELGDLIRKLEQMDHISSVSKGRCLYSAAFAPSFQVLISTPQSNGYKLLARFENKIQEILVDTTLDREKMKEYIRLCTFSAA